MKLIDTHSHLYSRKFDRDQEEVIARAQEVLEAVFLPNIDLESVESMLALTASAPEFFFPMMGLHPCDVKEGFEQTLEHVQAYLDNPDHTYYGVGETGLDLYWDKTTLDIQKISLQQHIDWAKSYELPIILHTRNATDEVIDMIEANADDQLSGIFHCFDGSLGQAQRVMAVGQFKLGIGGIVTYRKDVQEVVRQIPLESIVLETDSPYLPPAPHRKDKPRRNESSYTKYVGAKLAELHNTTYDEVARITNANALQVFPKARIGGKQGG
ncbi:MAG: TatD family hydrolase [Bacteroidota bacterium]